MSIKKFRLPLSLLGVFLLLVIFFLPLFQGKVLFQSDTQGWKGMVQEIQSFKDKTGEHSYWTGNLFSGMPTINIDSGSNSNLFLYAEKLFNMIPSAVWMLFITFLGFFVLLRVLGVKHWLALIGGVGYMLSSYFIIITAVGHVTKMHALSYFAFVVAGIILTYQKKYWKGGLLFAISLSLHIAANHPQITYYLLLLVLLYGVFELVKTIREKTWNHFFKASLVLVAGAILAVGTNAENLFKVYDYAKVSTRGEQILGDDTSTQGVDLTYATEWSYGIDETLTLLMPNLKGGGSNGKLLDKDSETYAVLEKMRVQNPEAVLKSIPTYWGPQLFTEGGVYVGALLFFFFVFGLFEVKGQMKWWLLSATLLSISLAWGRNFMSFYEFFYNTLPFFNKFRTPSMILVVAEFTIPLLGILGLAQAFRNRRNINETKKNLLWSGGITLGICLLLWLIPSLVGDFSGARDGQLPEPLRNALLEDRKALLRSDALRSIFFVLAGAIVLWFAFQNKLKQTVIYILLGLLVVIDLYLVDKRFLNEDNYVNKRKLEKFYPYTADVEILKDKELIYRVLDITESPFNSSRASYFHKSIGGYHAAKMRRYQDLIEHQLHPEMETLVEGLQAQKPVDSLMQQLPVLRMLNLKYLIYNPEASPIKTNEGLGNAWFINNVKIVDTPTEEMSQLGNIDPENTLVILKDESTRISVKKDAFGDIKMVRYAPNHLQYESESATGGVAVFSEIYHPDWVAKVDGKQTTIARVNYTLMAIDIPQGNHSIELIFKPQKYEIWCWIGLISSIVLLLLIGIFYFRLTTKRD
ncbi:YfhO family protein [Balneicella halophila]|nr:YfhO family protein [Balneicella halophila]